MKRYLIIASILAIVAITVLAFRPSALSPLDFKKWVEAPENGLVQSEFGTTNNYSLQYKPLEYVVINEKKQLEVEASEVEARKAQLQDLQYFTLRVRPNEGNHDILTTGNAAEQDYFTKADYYSYAFRDDIKLVANQDTLNCCLFNMIQSYGLTPHTDFVLAFPTPENQEEIDDFTVLIDDRITQDLPMHFEFNEADIHNIPQLITQ